MYSPQEGTIDVNYMETFEPMEIKNHFHNSHEIIYIEEGSASFNINNKTYICEGGDLIFISNLETHDAKIISYPYKRYFILVDPHYFQGLMHNPILTSILKHRPQHFNHVVNLSNEHKPIFRELLQKIDIENKNTTDFSQYKTTCYLQIFLIELFQYYKHAFPISSTNKSTNIILDVQKYLDENYKEDIKLEELAKIFFINMYYLSHQFKEVTGFSFKEYLILQRMSRAKHLLFHTSLDITNVCTESGFNNVNHFIRVFKKLERVTPYQYRKKLVE
jgi:YesN/AraC family two-component response regulator